MKSEYYKELLECVVWLAVSHYRGEAIVFDLAAHMQTPGISSPIVKHSTCLRVFLNALICLI
jgi:hypothetical protein